jgi:hypothetical protein
MANVRKGQLTPSPEWWKHLRWMKRAFWKRERQAEKMEILISNKDELTAKDTS